MKAKAVAKSSSKKSTQKEKDESDEIISRILSDFEKLPLNKKYELISNLKPHYEMEVIYWYFEDNSESCRVCSAFTEGEYYENIKNFLLEEACIVKGLDYDDNTKKYLNVPKLNIIDDTSKDDLENLVEVFKCINENDDTKNNKTIKVWHVDSTIKHLQDGSCTQEYLNHMLLRV